MGNAPGARLTDVLYRWPAEPTRTFAPGTRHRLASAQAWWIGVALWLCWALGLGMFALGGGSPLQTGSIISFQFAPAALMAPLWLLRKPRLDPHATDGCVAVRSVWVPRAIHALRATLESGSCTT